MWKMIASIVLLIGLLSWAIYDHHSKKREESQLQKPSASEISKASAKTGLQKGSMAPDFTLTTLTGDRAKLSDYRGKKVIVNFWATWCPPCKAEIPHIEEFYKENKDNNITVLAVNLTTAEKNKNDVQKFVKDQGLTFPVLLDQKGDIGNLYQAFTIPTSFFIDANGVIQEKFVGPMSKETMQTLVSKIK